MRGRVPIIASGFIADADQAFELIAAGANYIAVTDDCLTYEGPGILQRVNTGLTHILKQKNFNSITDAIGCDFENLTEEEEKNLPPKIQAQATSVTSDVAKSSDAT